MPIPSKIEITSELKLEQVSKDDIGSLVLYMNDREIMKNTLSVPIPYKYEDADLWINEVAITKSNLAS